MFLNRREEITRLRNEFRTEDGKLIIVYGRRRIGKSELLKRVLRKNDIYFLADLRETPLQVSSLMRELSAKIESFGALSLYDWDSVFVSLPKFIKRRTTLVLDEFPYLVKNSPELPSMIQRHFDLGNFKMLNLVLCGSSQSMMTNLFKVARAPLFGRASSILRIESLPAFHLQEMLGISSIRTIEEYSVWGGVPRYWQARAKYRSLESALSNLVMSKFGLFYDEPIILFLDEMRTSLQSSSILSLIAGGSRKLSEIASRLNNPATHISKPMQTMIELGYLKRETPFGVPEKNSKKSLYRINDSFLRFYFTYVVPNRSLIETSSAEAVKKIFEAGWSNYVAETYENLCREALPRMFRHSGSFPPGKRYWEKDLEIDFISKDANSDLYIVGEVKWQNSINFNSVVASLDKKISRVSFLKNARVRKVIIGKKPLTRSHRNYYSAEDVVRSLK